MLESIGGRKFLLSILVLGAGVGVHLGSPKGLSPELVALMLGIAGGFQITNMMANKHGLQFGNGAAAASEEQSSSEASEPAAPVPEQGLQEQMNEIRQMMLQVAQSSANTNKLLAAALGKPSVGG